MNYNLSTFLVLLILSSIILILLMIIRNRKNEIDDLRSRYNSVSMRSDRQAEEIREWRTIFGPFPSLYRKSPEADPGHDYNKNTIAIDLDGVISEYVDPWTGINHFGGPVPGAKESIKTLQDLGYKIVVYTTRNNALANHNMGHNALELTALVQNYLEKNEIPYDYISLFKPLARYYIDDRAVRFTGWLDTLGQIGYRDRIEIDARVREIFDILERPAIGKGGCE